MSEPTAVFAVGKFAEAVGDKRRSEDRKSFVPALEFSSSFFLNHPKQEFIFSRSHPMPQADSQAYAPHTDSTPVEKAADNHYAESDYPANQ